MRSAIAVVLVALGLLMPALHGAAPRQQGQQQTFRTSVNAVAVDVSVVDKGGAPVKDLGVQDFVVRVDGQPRQVSSAQFIDQSVRSPSASSRTAATFSSNQAADTGRLILLVVDQETIQPGTLRAPADVIGRLFDGFGPSDKVGLVMLPGPRMTVTFGGSREQIIDALRRTTGSKGPRQVPWMRGDNTPGNRGSFRPIYIGVTEAFRIEQGLEEPLRLAINRECAADRFDDNPAKSSKQLYDEATANCKQVIVAESRRIVGESRRESSQFVSGMRGILAALKSIDAPKTLVVLSQGLASPDAPHDMIGLDRDAAAARTTIHAVRLDRPMFDVENTRDDAYRFEDREALRLGLEAMVGRARGTIFEVTGSAAPAFDRLALEMSGYYLLGVEATTAERDGKPHRIEVAVPRRGVTVRSRPEFVFERPAPPRTSPRDDNALLMKTLGSVVVATTVPLRVATFNMADDDPLRVRVLVSAEIDQQEERAATATVGYVIYDQSGRVITDFARRSELQRSPSGALRFAAVPSIPAGSYTLKFAVAREGRAGSIEHRFTARLAGAARMTLGDLVLNDGREPGTQLTPPVDGGFSTDSVLAFVQVGARPGVPADASFVVDLVKTPNGPALITANLSPGAAHDGVQAVAGKIDVRLLPPGDYLARLVVLLGGQPVKTLVAPWSLAAPEPDGSARAASTPRAAAGPGERAPVTPLPDAPSFDAMQVLAPEVIGPFLDDVAGHSRAVPATALQAARAGRFDEAVAEMKVADGDPTLAFVRGAALLANAYRANASSEERRKILQAASEAFRETTNAAPDSMVGAFYIAACYAAGGRDEQAANAWQTSLARLDRYPVVYRLLADSLARTGQAARAVAVLSEAAAQWPEDMTFARRLAGAELAARMYDQALARIEAMIARTPTDASLIFLALQTLYERALGAPVSDVPALVARLERQRDLYVAANGPRRALVAEWIAYLKRRTS